MTIGFGFGNSSLSESEAAIYLAAAQWEFGDFWAPRIYPPNRIAPPRQDYGTLEGFWDPSIYPPNQIALTNIFIFIFFFIIILRPCQVVWFWLRNRPGSLILVSRKSTCGTGSQQCSGRHATSEWQFLRVLRKVAVVDNSKVLFTYKEVTSHLSQYILDSKDRFFDDRNIKIAHVERRTSCESLSTYLFIIRDIY